MFSTPFCPVWRTIPEMADITPVKGYHKELIPTPPRDEPMENLHVLARTSIFWQPQQGACQIRISADDYYKLYINGVFVAQGPAPAYPEHYYYNCIDATGHLKPGKNILAVHLYYQGLENRVWNSRDHRFALACDLCFEASRIEPEWRYRICHAYSGTATGYSTQFLENFDSRLWSDNWCLPEYDDCAWPLLVPAKWADYRLFPQPTQLLDVYEIPAQQIRRKPGCIMVDFGCELTGALVLKAQGSSGSQITIRCGEECLPDGQVRFDMRCNCHYEEIWTLDDGVCTLEPYDYKGFRYAQILFDPNTVTVLNLCARIRHYPMDENACTLQTGDSLTDRIFQICKHGVRLGTQEGFLDCPTREKGQYLNDAVVTAHAHAWLTGKTDMLRKTISQFGQTASICPGLMAVAPGCFMQEIADASLLWGQLLMVDYKFTGDLDFLRQWYPIAKGIAAHFAGYARPDGLLSGVTDKWNLVDWPENLRDNYDFALTKPIGPGVHCVINALYIGALKTLEQIEQLLGIPSSVNWHPIANAFVRAFYRPEQKRFADSETSNHCSLHANIYTLYFQLAPADAIQAVADFLVQKGLCCGVWVAYFYLKALCAAGRWMDAYAAIKNETEHGWVQMLREDATACFEAWGKDQKWNTSLCHPWASAPVIILLEDIAGLTPAPDTPQGYHAAPHLPCGANWTVHITTGHKRHTILLRSDKEATS